jgi:large subunit ribosomal protein L10
VKNTLGRIAARESGNEALLALLEGPTAIAFLEADGDLVAAAKALADAARTTRILTIRGGVLQGKIVSGDDVGELAKLPPVDILRGQVLGAVIGPLTQLIGLVSAPLQNLVGLIDARIDQLGGEEAPAAAAPEPEPEVVAEAEAEPEPEAVAEVATEEESTVEEGAEASTSESQEEE